MTLSHKAALGVLALGVALVLGQVFLSVKKAQSMRSTNPAFKVLRIMTHSSFAASLGPGPELKALFEKQCAPQCQVEFLSVGSGHQLIERLRAHPQEVVDFVAGLDLLSLQYALRHIKWHKITQPKGIELQEAVGRWSSMWFLPYDYAPLGFIYRSLDNVSDFATLTIPQVKVSVPNPEFSSLGMHMLIWAKKSLGLKQGIQWIKKIKPRLVGVMPSWSGSYGLLRSLKANVSFSYLTSLEYHLQQNQTDFKPAIFTSGHPLQVEFMAIPATCFNCKLAQKMANLMLSPKGQKILMKKNYMLPAIKIPNLLKQSKLPKVKILHYTKADISAKNQTQSLKMWSD